MLCCRIINKKQSITSLCFVYGDYYCAKPEIYTTIKDKTTQSIKLHDTNKIARIKKVDSLGITDLRVRGMWGIKHSSKVFEYITQKKSNPYIKALMLKSKFESFKIKIKRKI